MVNKNKYWHKKKQNYQINIIKVDNQHKDIIEQDKIVEKDIY